MAQKIHAQQINTASLGSDATLGTGLSGNANMISGLAADPTLLSTFQAPKFRGATASDTIGDTIPFNLTHLISWNSTVLDTDSIFSGSGVNLVVPAGVTRVSLHANLFTTSALPAGNWDWRARIEKNGSVGYQGAAYNEFSHNTVNNPAVTLLALTTPVIPVAGSDVFRIWTFQNSGAAFSLNADSSFSMVIHE